MIISLFLVFLAVVLTGISQVLLKFGSRVGAKGQFLSAYLNMNTLCGYVLLLVVTVISVIALREVPLKTFYALASLNFVIVPMMSWKFLGEEISKKQFSGICLIIVGIVIFNL